MHQDLRVSPQKNLVMTTQMAQALNILQMPQQELASFLQEEIDKNPLLEQLSNPKAPLIPCDIPSTPSVYENLLFQISMSFSKQDASIAKKMLENLDEKGFLSTPLDVLANDFSLPIEKIEEILQTLQAFDPPGIFARNTRESLLLQLKAKGSVNTDAYRLIENHYEDLLSGKYSKLKKTTDLAKAIEILSHLQIRPLGIQKQETAQPIFPDLFIEKVEDQWFVGIKGEELPQFVLSQKFDACSSQSKEEKKMLQTWKVQGKTLLSSLAKRKEILLKIGVKIVKRQAQYLSQKGKLQPLTVDELKEQLGLHESTLFRAISGKYVETPRGIIPLKALISSSPEKKEAKEALQDLISTETTPLSDDALSDALKKKGFSVARRTVSKYRKELKIPNAKFRLL